MPLKQEELGVSMLTKPFPPPDIDEIFKLLFDDEVLASVALAQISGFAPIPCYEFRWFYERELPVFIDQPQHRALLKQFGSMWQWVKTEDASGDEPYYLGEQT